jgi:sugar lactone lactonase YvrE
MAKSRALAVVLAFFMLSVACSFGVDVTGFFGGQEAPVDSGAMVRPISIAPMVAVTDPGGRVQFTSDVTPSRAAVWSVAESAAGGTVSPTGNYAAPYAAGVFHVTVTASDGASATATVTVPPSVKLLAGRTDGYVDGPAKDARFRNPFAMAFDPNGNLYFTDFVGHTLRKLSAAGLVSTVAGKPDVPGGVDGIATDAQFFRPTGVCVGASGNIYVADYSNHAIRRVTPTGTVTTFAGKMGAPGGVDGSATDARFSAPVGIVADADENVYVSEQSHTIRKITPAGVVSTLAGIYGVPGEVDGSGTSARFTVPSLLAIDAAGVLYVSDQNGHTIRKITTAGVVSTVAGTANVAGYQDGPAATALFYRPTGIAIDATGTIYVAEYEPHRLRKISPLGIVSTIAGDGPDQVEGKPGGLQLPIGVTLAADGRVLIAEGWGAIRAAASDGALSTLAGLTIIGTANGEGSAASFREINGIAVDTAGNAYVGDLATVRKITPEGAVTTYAGQANLGGSANGPAERATFSYVRDLATDASGNLYVADRNNYLIRKVGTNGVVSTVAGDVGKLGAVDGQGAAAQFGNLEGVASDAVGNLMVADLDAHAIRSVDRFGVVKTVTSAPDGGAPDAAGGPLRFTAPAGLAYDRQGSLWIADEVDCTIRQLDASGSLRLVAGTVGNCGYSDGTAALFNFPWKIAIDSEGGVFVGDHLNRAIRGVAALGTTTIAGSPYATDITILGALPGNLHVIRGVAALPGGTLLVATQFAVYRIVRSR